MKQPELGITIQSLRQDKQLTQEELVEMCNLNVRTLQRIEAGEVTPRDYTIKAIFSALDYKMEEVVDSIQKQSAIATLQIAWIAGIIYFVLGVIEAIVDTVRFDYDLPNYFPFLYTTVKLIVLAGYISMMLGFVEIGKMFKHSLLKIGAFLMLGAMCIIEIYDIITIFSGLTEDEFLFVKGIESVAFGGTDIIFGIALLQLHQLGLASRVAGGFEIVAGMFFITFILAFVGMIMLVPATILEVVLLFKTYDYLKNE
ncbi:MAG: helix-turn-helix transcriptional regulator [Cyclobacteriaceae bacterium]